MNKKKLYELFKNLVNIYSPSGKEKEICDFIYNYLTKFGLKVIKQPVDSNRYNLIVLNDDYENSILFTGHIDTVPAYDYEQYDFEETDGEIYGLGTADMKSGCAAMIEAFISYYEENKSLPASLAIVVGEEEYGDGTSKLLEEYHFPWAIVTEPTGLMPCLKHYGYIEISLSTTGKRMHASLSEKKHNAINKMLNLILKITDYLDFNRKKIIYNIRDMISSQAGFVVPDRCEAGLDLHIPPYYPIGEVTVEIEELVRKNFDSNYKIEYSMIHSGYDLPVDNFLNDKIKKVYSDLKIDYQNGTFFSDSDAALLWQAGIKPIILGPGFLEKAHTSYESINFEQVIKASQIYYNLLKSFI